MAAFQLSTFGRFWVSTEALRARRTLAGGRHILTVKVWSVPQSFVEVSVFAAAPRITGMSPLAGRKGDRVALVGVNLLVGSTSATFGRSRFAQSVAGSRNQLTVIVPAKATIGAIHVSNALGTADSPSPS